MARSYLGRSDGFADGFTSGFGLINNAINDKRKIDSAEEELQYRRGQDTLDREQTQLNFDAQQAKLDRQFGLDKQRLTAQEEANKVSRETGLAQADAAKMRAETDAATETRLQSVADAEQAEREQAEYMTRATNAYGRINTMLQAPVGTYSYDQINEAIEDTAGGALDIRALLGADFQADIAGMTSELTKGIESGNLDLNNRAILDGLTSMFDSRRGRLIGKTVDETFTNAPDQFKTGDWEVSDRFVTKVNQNEDDPSMLSATVGIRVVNKKTGESAYYDAPLTENRGANAAPVGISITDALDGVAGTSILLQEIEKFRPDIERGLIRQKFGDDNVKFENAVDAEIQRTLKRASDDGGEVSSVIPTKLNSTLTIDDHRNLARSKVLGTGRGEKLDFRGDRLRVVSETKEELAPILARALQSDADGNISKLSFTNSEILRMNAIGNKSEIESYIRGLAKNKGGFFQDPKKNPRRGVAASAMKRNSGD